MTNSFENPFIPKPDNLKPDSAEFLQKFAGASNDQLDKAGIHVIKTGLSSDAVPMGVDDLKTSVSEAEKETYANEKVQCGGIELRREEAIPVQRAMSKINRNRIANGQPEISFESERKIMKLRIGGQSKEALKTQLQETGVYVSDDATVLLDSEQFEVSAESRDIILMRLTADDLGFTEGASINQMYEKAQEFGLHLCPSEVGPWLRLNHMAQSKYEWLLIAMEAIPNPYNPVIFDLNHRTIDYNGQSDDKGPRLEAFGGGLDTVWGPGLELVFSIGSTSKA